MRTKTLTMMAVLLTALLALTAPVGALPPGPMPGSDPVTYATGHYGAKAAEATSDPVAFAGRTATPAAVGNETATLGYIACWEIYTATGQQTPGCELFFTAPGQGVPANQKQPPAANATEEVVAGALALANTTLGAVQEIVADPSQAPTALQQVADAVVAFILGVVDVVVATLSGLGTGLQTLGQFGLDGLLAGVDGIALAGSVAGDGIAVAFVALGEGTIAAAVAIGEGIAFVAVGIADGVVFLAVGLADGVTFVAVAIGQSVATASAAVADGAVTAVDAVADGVVNAADAVADGVTNAVQAVADAVGSLFGGEAKSPDQAPAPALPQVSNSQVETGLLDEVVGTLE